MANEPTREEILRWKERLEDRDFQRRLLRFQNHLHQVFEDLRKQTGLHLIRAIIVRDEVKSLESLVEKIRRKRQEQKPEEKPYDFGDVKDLVGIKILCPYQNDVDSVIDYLYQQPSQFRVLEKSKAEARREDPHGYRGYNFTMYPAMGAPAGWTPLWCEVQIKTIIEEAWDAKTHDLTYKREIPPTLRQMFADLSGLLAQGEKLGESIREQIEDLLSEVQRHKELATSVLFAHSVSVLRKMRETYGSIPQIEQPRPLSAEEIAQINEALRCERFAGRLDREMCQAAALVALCHGGSIKGEFPAPGQVALALQLVDEFAEGMHANPDAQGVRAQVYWAFSRFDRAVEYSERAFDGSNTIELSDANRIAVWSDLCYYVADATVFQTFVPKATIELALRLVQQLMEIWNRERGRPNLLYMADTIGFTKIVLGRDATEVREGLNLVRQALQMARQQEEENRRTKDLAEAFCLRHIHIGEKHLRHFGVI